MAIPPTMNPMLASLLTGSMNKGQGAGGPSGLLDSLMGILSGNGGDIDGVLKGIGFAGLMKELPRVMNAAMDWKSSEQPGQEPGDVATPDDSGGPAPGPMGPMGAGGPPGGMPPGPGGPGGNPMQLLMALAAARAQAGAPMGSPGGMPGGPPLPGGPAGGPAGMPPLAQLLMRRRMG